MAEIVANDRLIGGLTPACAQRGAAIYRFLLRGRGHPHRRGQRRNAKLAENASFGRQCGVRQRVWRTSAPGWGLDVWEIRRLANRHPRVDILKPGPGVGGHCVAVDPWFIVAAAGEDAPLIRAARQVNDGRPRRVAAEIVAACRETGAAAVACLGLAFKARGGRHQVRARRPRWPGCRGRPPGTPVLTADPFLAAPPARLVGLANLEFTTAAAAVRAAGVGRCWSTTRRSGSSPRRSWPASGCVTPGDVALRRAAPAGVSGR